MSLVKCIIDSVLLAESNEETIMLNDIGKNCFIIYKHLHRSFNSCNIDKT